MKYLSFYFDPRCPDAAQAFDALPEALAGHSVEVVYRPVPAAAQAPQDEALLHLAWACAAPAGQPGDTPGRWVVEQLLHHVRQHGGAARLEDLAELARRLAPPQDPAGEAVKQRLRREAAAARALGVSGELPVVALDGRLFPSRDLPVSGMGSRIEKS
ncbi:MAG: DsbA family protein [Roseateles sp.]|uniref:DsbA family protein n=1 Tax=Roseateles sp. TaxID=1971397 RepID=UPI0039EB9C58